MTKANMLFTIALFVVATIRAHATPAQLTVLLLVDNSGSMKASDPAGLRFTAVEMIAALLDANDRLGVLVFSTTAQRLTDGLISPQEFHGLLPLAPQGYTDIRAALLEAGRLLAGNDNDPSQRNGIILLTDGKPEIENPYPGYQQEILDMAGSLGIPVYAIALTSQADLSFLERLAAASGGQVFPAGDASDLLDAYLRAFNAIQDRTILGERTGNAPLEIDPALAPYIQKASFVLGKPEGMRAALLDPTGQAVTTSTPGVTIHENPRFLVVTVRQPQGGAWQFQVSGTGAVRARAVLYSRLRVQVISPQGLQKLGDSVPIVVRLVEERADGQPVTVIGEATFSGEITRPDGRRESLDRFYDDGTHGDLLAGDGDFTRLYAGADLSGQYRIVITGRKGAVPVAQEMTFEVADFPHLVISAPSGDYEILDTPVPLIARLTGGVLERGEVLARVTAPSGRQVEILLEGQAGEYAGSFLPDENGPHSVQFETREALYRGAPFWEAARAEFTVRLARGVTAGSPESQVVMACLDAAPRITISLPITSLRREQIELALGGFVAQPAAFSLQPGEQTLVFDIFPLAGKATGEAIHVNLNLVLSPGIPIQPGAILPLQFDIPSPWARCRQPLTWGGLGLFGLLGSGVLLAVKLRRASAPVIVSGTLRCWLEGQSPAEARERDLTALARPALRIGSQAGCDLAFPESGLDEEHALLLAEISENGLQVVLQPVGTVQKGYGVLHGRMPLGHGDIFWMGGLNFQYLSDSGE